MRIEFFGDEIDSIRGFDPETQLSTSQLNEIEIVPMRESWFAVRISAPGPRRPGERWSDTRYARALARSHCVC